MDGPMDQVRQVKSAGQVLPHWLRRRTRSTGTFRLMPRTLALMAVQRQTAALRSASPDSSGQHCSVDGTPRLSLSRFSTLAHTPSFSVSIEQVPPPPVDGVGGAGVGITGAGGGTAIGGVGTGVGLEQYDPQPCAVAARSARFTARKRASVVDAIAMLEAVASSSGGSYKLGRLS
ncbi:hypothetical protein ACQ4PT_003418 [Festuca glaucescens]